MFDPVTAKLLQTAPPLEDLDPNDLPSMLTRQYAELVARRLRGAGVGEAEETAEPRAWPLSRIADAYEIVTSIHGDPAVRRAAAFVAATANQILARQAVVTKVNSSQSSIAIESILRSVQPSCSSQQNSIAERS